MLPENETELVVDGESIRVPVSVVVMTKLWTNNFCF